MYILNCFSFPKDVIMALSELSRLPKMQFLKHDEIVPYTMQWLRAQIRNEQLHIHRIKSDIIKDAIMEQLTRLRGRGEMKIEDCSRANDLLDLGLAIHVVSTAVCVYGAYIRK